MTDLLKLKLGYSSDQTFPKDKISISQIWSGQSNSKQIASSDIIMVSLFAASKNKYVVLDCNNKGVISAKEIKPEELTSRYSWKMIPIQFNLPGPSPGCGFLMYHQSTGYYLTVENDIPVGKSLKDVSHDELSPFMWGNRFTDRDFLYLGNPDQEYFCSRSGMNPAGGGGFSIGDKQICMNTGLYGLAGTCTTDCDSGGDKYPGYCFKGTSQKLLNPGASGQLATALNNSILSGVSCPDFNVTWPIGGKPYIRVANVNGKWEVKMSGVVNNLESYNITRINDVENEWYSLPVLKTDSLPTPVCRSWSVQQMLDWDPSLDYNAPFNRSRIKRKERFTDSVTQADTSMVSGPHKVCLTVNNLPEGWMNCQDEPNPYVYNFQFWNSIDYLIFGTNDQGWAPTEFKGLKIPACCPSKGTESLYEYLDGARSGGPSQIFIPPRSFIDSAHEHGVKVLGSIFFQEQYYGSRWEWLEKFANNWKETAHKLVDMAIYYGHDGYFLDNETMPIAYVSAEKKNETYVYSQNLTRSESNYSSGGGKSVDLDKEGDKIELEQFWSHYYRRGQSTGGWCFLTPCQRTDTVSLTRGTKTGYDLQQDVFNNLVKLGQEFRKYADSKNSDVELIFYECMNNSGAISYSGGIFKDNSKIWATENGPTFDGILTMTPNQSIVGAGQTSTYMRTKESVDGCQLGKTNAGWPNNLGPKFTKNNALQADFNCVKENFTIENYGPNDAQCQNIPKSDYQDCKQTTQESCNKAGCCWDPDGAKAGKHPYWCYKTKEDSQPDNVASTCGSCDIDENMLNIYKNFPKNKSYKFFATGLECGNFDVDIGLNSVTPQMASSGWLKDYYCGSQNCPSLDKVVGKQAPLTSLSFYGCGSFDASKFTFEKNVIATSGAFFPPDRELPGDAPPPTDNKMHPLCYILPERSTLTTLPFYTSFDLGQGKSFCINGEIQKKYGSFSDHIQTQQPTFMFWPTKKKSGVEAMINLDKPYMGGSSLRLKVLPKSEGVDFNLYKVKWSLEKDITISAMVCLDEVFNPPDDMTFRLGYWHISNGNKKVILGKSKIITDKWSEISFTIPASDGYVGMITIGISGTNCDAICYVGSISAYYTKPKIKQPENLQLKISNTNQGELSWKADPDVLMYYIYNEGEFIGRIKSGNNALDEPIRYNIQNLSGNYSVVPQSKIGEVSSDNISTFSTVSFSILLILLSLIILGFLIMNKNTIKSTNKFLYSIIVIINLIFVAYLFSGKKRNNKNICLILLAFVYMISILMLADKELHYNGKILLFINLIIVSAILLCFNYTNDIENNNSKDKFSHSDHPLIAQMVDLTQKPYPLTQTLNDARNNLRNDALQKYEKIKNINPKLASLFYNSYLCPISHCISNLDDEFSYTITGNWGKGPPLHTGTVMGGMWIRDAVLQIKPYIKNSVVSKPTSVIIKGILNQCMRYFMDDSYANAFNPYPQFSTDATKYNNGAQGEVTTANYEMDGPCFLFMVIAEYTETTGDKSIVKSSRFVDSFRKYITQLQKEQHRFAFQLKVAPTDNMKLVGNNVSLTEQTTYRFSEMANNGIGSYVSDMNNGKGMSYSAFRPSDDVSVFGYNVPDNMLAVATIDKISKYLEDQQLLQQAKYLSKSIDAAIKELGIFNHPVYGKMYAFELDGLGADTFFGDGTTKDFTLNGSINPDCTKYNQNDQFGSDTGCNPYYPYLDKTTRIQPPNGGDCSMNSTANVQSSGGTSTDPRLVGTRYLEILVDGKPVEFANVTLSNRTLTFDTPPLKNSTITVRGNFNLMDDANLPSLLSIPWFGYTGSAWSQEIYENTRKFCLSPDNRWFYNYGKTGISGIGSGHTAISTQAGPGMVWPMAIVARGFTRITNDNTIPDEYIDEITEAINMLLMSSDVDLINTGVGISPVSISPYQAPGYIHESVWVTDVNKYTRGFFGWANAYFAEFMINVLSKNNAKNILSKVKLSGKNTRCN